MEYVILGLLMIEANTLYGLHKCFEQGISMFYSSSLGSLQSASKRLEAKGYITVNATQENGRAKKVFSITEAGMMAFFNWLNGPLEPQNLEVAFLSRLYFVGLIPEKPQRKLLLEQMRAAILQSKTALDQASNGLDQLQLPEAYQTIFYYQRKVLQYGIDTHGYGLNWLDALIEDLI